VTCRWRNPAGITPRREVAPRAVSVVNVARNRSSGVFRRFGVGRSRDVDERPAGPDPLERRAPRLARWYAVVLVRLRWLVLVGCLAGGAAAILMLPELHPAGIASVLSVVPRDAAPIQTEIAAVRHFRYPVLSHTVIVVRNENRLSALEQKRVVDLAVRLDRHRLAGGPKVPGSGQIAGAVPIVNTRRIFPSSTEDGTTALLYLFYPPQVSVGDQNAEARALAHRYLDDGGTFVGVTGLTAADQQQNDLVTAALPWVELGALLVIALVMGLKFRCIGAPVAALLTAGLAYEISTRLVAWSSERYGVSVPGELGPLLTVLVAGVSTDYSIFFISAFRDGLRERPDARAATQQAIAGVAPIVVAAGISVIAGTATLSIAGLGLFRQLGPGMAISVAVSALAALIFLPALLACAGRAVFLPGRAPRPARRSTGGPHWRWWRRGAKYRVLSAVVNHRPLAALVLLVAVGALGAGAVGLTRITVGTDLIADLPANSPPAAAAHQAASGFSAGTLAPTEILLRGSGLNRRHAALVRFQQLIADQPQVAGVIGPAEVPLSNGHDLAVTTSGDAARYVVILAERPYGGPAISTLSRLQARLPAILSRAGLPNADVGLTGDTALSGAITTASNHDLIKVGFFAVGLLLLILIIYLRALVAPVLLMIATLVSVLAALGLTTWLFQGVLGAPGLTFYVPFAAAVLLLSFGSDYNVFLVGRIWQGAPTVPFRQRIIDGATRAGRTITTAGITLSLSFALLAIVPLMAFREFAFAMFVGILLDTFIVRSLIVPAMLAVLGPVAAWPSGRSRQESGARPSRSAGDVKLARDLGNEAL
jgi:putative drug exporter of the RND superfamily